MRNASSLVAVQGPEPPAGLEAHATPSAAVQDEQDGSSDDDSPSAELGTGLVTSSGALLSGLAGLSAHEEESRRAQEYWKRAAAPYQAVDTLRLASSGGHVSWDAVESEAFLL